MHFRKYISGKIQTEIKLEKNVVLRVWERKDLSCFICKNYPWLLFFLISINYTLFLQNIKVQTYL